MTQKEGQQQTDIENTYNQLLTQNSFDQFQLKEELLRGIYAYGFELQSKIQSDGMPPIIQGNDVIIQANSGTGKTALYVIGVLQLVDVQLNYCQALIIVPTRELAWGVNQMIKSIGAFQNISTHAATGGINTQSLIQQIQKSVHIIVGTPYRVLDLAQRNYLDLQNLKIFILDEADETFERGLKEQIYQLVMYLPKGTQKCIFTSIFLTQILKFSFNYLRDPIKIRLKQDQLPIEQFKYYFITIEKEE